MLIKGLRYDSIILLICALLLTACGENEDNTPVSVRDVEEFFDESDEEAAADLSGGLGSDSLEAGNDGSLQKETGARDDQPDQTQESMGSDTGDESTAGITKYNGLTREQFDALTLEEQDKVRDTARKKLTPAYEDRILPEYRELYDYNKAVIGYIYIDGTVFDAPELQTLDDYEYYLHRDIDGRESEPGCIILDADSEIGIGTAEDGYLEEYEPSTIQLVHGHNMRNGTMFGSLLKYADGSYADSHAVIQYDSIYEHRSYEVVCAFYSQIYPEDSGEFKYYTYNQLDTEDEYNVWWSNISDMALYMRDVESGYGDGFIVLSTCAYQVENGRFAVVGVRKH